MPAVAMTDHGNIFGAVEFANAAKEVGVKPILGCELYICKKEDHRAAPEGDSYNHLIVLAENDQGYRNLVKIVSEASLHGFYYKPRISKKFLAEHSQGLIALSGMPERRSCRRADSKASTTRRAQAAATLQRHLRQGQFLSSKSRTRVFPKRRRIQSQSAEAGTGPWTAAGGHQRQPLSVRGRRPRAGRDGLHPDRQVDPRHQPAEVRTAISFS